ncbi:neuroligin-4, X-linked-like isoform X4 [Mytilus californianus]|uniref:neuroligin-4, X-linked-like isoform X4 n=1 Tax=Mytilus californianus TaxID=6549 RepID=UPI002246D141|nr:neuroligin-4, X-linked-like isoform X4 [Mytilus californianus]
MNFLLTKILCLLVGFFTGCIAPVLIKSHASTKVRTPYGEIRGLLVELPHFAHLKSVEAYFGLQFASIRSPSGSLRFSVANTPKERWNTIKYINETNVPTCPQRKFKLKELNRKWPAAVVEKIQNITSFVRDVTEDCLRFNIYVPTTDWNNTSKLPVMVFVHGESYEIGTGNAYEGSVLASYGEVIVVTVNYRLGVLGFLSTGDNEASGNYALWDLFAVLSWIHDNIGAFGGDTNRVTLFGHGYGAALVNILLLSPMVSTRLIQRAILQSGSALSPWAVSFDAVTCTQWLAVNVNCSQYLSDSELLVKCLRNKTATELVEHVPLPPKYYSCFAPTPGGGQMFPDNVRELLKRRDTVFSQIPVMFGVTRNEAYSYLKQRELEEGITKERKAQIIRTFVHNLYKFHRQKLYEIIDFQYTEWNKEQDRNTTRDNVMDMLSDGLYVAPVVEMAHEHAKRGAGTYFYNFGYSTQSENFPQWSSGVHGDELPYVFGAPLVDGISPFPSRYTKNEKKLSAAVMRFWTNFAKSGDPNVPLKDTEQDKFSDVYWPKYDMAKQRYFHIETNPCYGEIGEETCWDTLGKRPQIKHHYRGSELALWLNLIPQINKKQDPNTGIKSETSQHELLDWKNISTFDDPDGLVSKFTRLFPLPPPTPPVTRLLNDVHVTNHPGFDGMDRNYHRSTPRQTSQEEITDPPKEITTNENPAIAGERTQESIATSSVPLSITVAIGCSLLFINILIYAGVYYQRERIKKIKQGEAANASRNSQSRGNSNEPDGDEITTVPVNHLSGPLPNSKPDIQNNPVYSVISKQSETSDKYSYTPVPTNTNSPMHRTRVPHSQTNSIASSSKSGNSLNHISGKPPDRSPHGSDRSVNKHNQTSGPGSNNAITIV